MFRSRSMSFKVVHAIPKPPAHSRPDRLKMLGFVVIFATWWLILNGMVGCIANLSLAWHLKLRYATDTYPLFKGLAAAQLVLGIYLERMRRNRLLDPLAVDTLLLYFLLASLFHLLGLPDSRPTHGEKVIWVMDGLLALALVWLRNTHSLIQELWRAEASPRISALAQRKSLKTVITAGTGPDWEVGLRSKDPEHHA